MSLLAPSGLFSAVALATEDDSDLPRGTHLRLLPSPVLGFPIAPFGVLRVKAWRHDEPRVDWRDRAGQPVPPGEVGDAGPVLATILEPDDDSDVTVAVEVMGEFEGTAALLHKVADRVIARRSMPPYLLGAPRVERLLLTGRGRVRLRLWRVSLRAALDVPLDRAGLTLLSLPVEGTRPWYVGGLGLDPADRRVADGAPLRLGPPDQPDGPFDAVPPDDEALRIAVHRAAIVEQCELMLRDPGTTPRQVVVPVPPAVEPDGVHSAELKIEGGLLLQAMDPGIGRLLGLVTRLDEPSDPTEPAIYAACGVFAVDPRAPAPGMRTLGQALGGGGDPFLSVLLPWLTRGAEAELGGLMRHVRQSGLELRLLVALAAAVPPPDRPETPEPLLARARWLDGRGAVSDAFRQDFVWPNNPLSALVALGRQEAGAWVSRHRAVDLPAGARVAQRRLPMLLGRTGETEPLMPSGLLSDSPVPVSEPAMRYRVAMADLFGRFGPPAEFAVPPLPRPAPPPPAPQLQVVPDGPTDGSAAAASPGRVVVTVPVPGQEALAAGALGIAEVEIALDGAWQPALAAPRAGGAVSLTLTLPATESGGTARGVVAARFRDPAGTPSAKAELPYACADQRHPPVIPAGKGLIWTSRPGPAPEVELALAWPAAPGTRFRAFLADATSLGLVGATRAEVAVAAGEAGVALGGRESFRLLTDPPVIAAADGRAMLRETLPRSLRPVQILRIVPVSATGREAPFAECPAVAVAVPSDRRPPPPRVTVRVDAAKGRATIRIAALGLDRTALKDGAAPEYRLRRAQGAMAEPLYARILGQGPLLVAAEDGEPAFVAEVEDPDPLSPFLPVTYCAEVRMPSERRLPEGLVELPPDGGITPLSEAQRQDMPGLFSPFSALATANHAPRPAPPEGLTAVLVVEPGGSLLRLAWPNPPRLRKAVVGRYALRIWEGRGGGALGPALPDVPLDDTPLAWDGPLRAEPGPATVFAALVDPLGRVSEPVTMIVP